MAQLLKTQNTPHTKYNTAMNEFQIKSCKNKRIKGLLIHGSFNYVFELKVSVK
jgi:hypothetical protein